MDIDSSLSEGINAIRASDRQFHRSVAYLDPHPSGQPAVLLLHGLGANGESWGFQASALMEAGLRPIAVDLPGFGRSDCPHGRWSIRTSALAISDLIEDMCISPIFLVGHSLGGTVAQVLADERPDLIGKLVLVNTFARLRPRRATEWLYLLRRFLITNLYGHGAQAELVAWRIFPHPEQGELRALLKDAILSTDPRVYRQAIRALAWFDMRARLPAFRMPTLIITGQEDTTVGLPVQAQLAQLIPGARQVILNQAGHAAPIDQAAAFNRVLIDFLAQS